MGGVLSERPLTGKTGDLGVTKKGIFFFIKRRSFRSAQVGKAEQRMVYFKKGGGVFWSGLRRNSTVAKSDNWGGGLGAFARHIPVLSLYGNTRSPGLGFCNFRLENKFRTNFNPILTKCWVKFVKIGNAIRVFTIF